MTWLWSLRQPTLILSGDEDPLVPLADAKIMQNLIPHAKLYLYNGAIWVDDACKGACRCY